MEGCTWKKAYFLGLMSTAYIVGEIAHFLINTSSREVAQEIGFGDQACFLNTTRKSELGPNGTDPCPSIKNQSVCVQNDICTWDYNGIGLEYQILAGPAFTWPFAISAIILAVISDWLYDRLSRAYLLAGGTLTFSVACLLMGLAGQYWQLFLLRMLIAAGESVCRPTSGALIAELFPPSSRGLANGIFSWGVYYGYGLAFVFGIYITQANIAGYLWRAPYILAGVPGIVIGILLIFTVSDPRQDVRKERKAWTGLTYFKSVFRNFLTPSMLILLLAACARQTAGLTWAFNTRPFFQQYYPDFDLGVWILCASVFGGSFGVFAGGFFSDRLVNVLGLASRLWILALCTLLAAPLAFATLYLPPPQGLICLIAYYFLAETWFAVLFTVIVEIVEPEVRSTIIAVFLFCMNVVGGNLPVVVAPLKLRLDDYREALYVMWPGNLALSSLLFLLASIPLFIRDRRLRGQTPIRQEDSSSKEDGSHEE